MLNKDCKVRSAAAINSTKKKSKSTYKGNKKNSKSKNKFFSFMVIIWLVPVFISGYLLYLQYKQYVKRSEIHTSRDSSFRGRNISREQIRNLRRKISRTRSNRKKAKIYLVKVNRVLGRIYLKSLKTSLALSHKKIGQAIKKLILYKLSRNQKRKNYYSCIPKKTLLLGYKVKNRTLLLNFNMRFITGSYGTQQIKLKAAQIVYTATQFPNINKVKFQVNGRKLKDWGGEGVFPGAVLSRADVPRIMRLN